MRNFLFILFASLTIPLFANVQANFSADKLSGCSPLVVTFSNTSQPSNSNWFWDFGNGNTSTLANPSAVFNVSGVYQVKLVVSNGTQKDSVTKAITVFRLPQVEFHAVKTDVCQGDSLFLINDIIPGDAPITNYAWGFGNGIASSFPNPSYTYNALGSYNITLVVQDGNACTANKSKASYIQVLSKPNVSFTASPLSSCNASELVSFTNTSTGPGVSYFWNLDDGATSTDNNPTHTYNQEKRDVALTATNSNGCSATASTRISVGVVIPDFISKTKGCTGEQIQFTNTSNIGASAAWNFGDGTVSGDYSPIKIYETPGIYTVTLTQSDGACSNTIVKSSYITIRQGFSVSFADDQPPGNCDSAVAIVDFTSVGAPAGSTYSWNFGDNGYSSDQNPSHAYSGNGNFNIVLTVTDTSGCVVKTSKMTQISLGVGTANFRADTLSCPGGAVRFHTSFIWNVGYLYDFGDGTFGGEANPTHFYAEPGVYTVSLKITSGQNCEATVTKTNYIRVVAIQTDFSVNETFSPCPPFVTIFKSSASRNDLAYTWDFGDGTTVNSDTENTTHIYFYPGVFTAKMTTTTSNGCINVVTYPDLIQVQGPTGVFSTTSSTGCIPLNITLDATLSSNTKSIWCDLGDGTLISDSTHFEHTYSVVNTFNPKIVLVDHVGCAVPYNLPPIVTRELPMLSVADTFVCQAAKVSVFLGAERYRWTPASYLSCDTCAYVDIVPEATTAYTVTAINRFGCEVSKVMTISVDSIPVLTSPDTITVCKNSSVDLFAGNAYHIQWSPGLYLSDFTIANPVCYPQQSLVYEVTGSNSLGCSTKSLVPVKVIEKIELDSLTNLTVCAFEPFQLNPALTIAPNAEMRFDWTPANLNIPTNNPNPTVNGLSRTTNFQVIASSGTCIPDTASFTVEVLNLPDMEVSDKAIITTASAEISLSAASHQDLNYSWTSVDPLSCADCRRTNAYPVNSQFIYVTGTNRFGCRATDSVAIEIVPCDPKEVFLPNIFTPNNDGLNDKFLLRSRAVSSLNYFRVFNQWGELVFETKNIAEGWDGTIKGQPAPVAVYVCSLGGKCDNGFDVTKSSNITLIR